MFDVAKAWTRRRPVSAVDTRLTAGIPLTKKKIAELELSLLHLQQNVEIPEISLPIPTLVQTAITQVSKMLNEF